MRATLLPALLLLAPGPARAAVSFTGYADLRFNAVETEIMGSAAALTAAGETAGTRTTGGARADSLGLFGETEIKDELLFRYDLSFRDIGQNVSTVRFQYAYLVYKPAEDVSIKGGKVTLPFGYYNENCYYPFLRHPVAAPLMLNTITGLPLADWGVIGTHRIHFGGRALRYSLYSVNGFGHNGTTPTVLRKPSALSTTNTMAANLRATDNNHEQSVGGQVALERVTGGSSETGFSYYRGVWDAAGTKPLQMMNAHLFTALGPLEILWEGMQLDAKGDTGLGPALGAGTDNRWRTRGHFLKLGWLGFQKDGKGVTPFLQAEDNRTDSGGRAELLSGGSAGVAVDAGRGLRLKLEYRDILYRQPFEDKGPGEVVKQRFKALLVAAVVTF